MTNVINYRKKLFGEVIRTIKSGLESGKFTSQRAREIARFMLNSLPKNINTREIFIKVPKFADQYPELFSVSLVARRDYEKLVQEKILPQAQKLISENRFAEATELMQKASKKEINL